MIILASQSPRRKEILGKALSSFAVVATECDESFKPGTPPCDIVKMLSARKASAVPASGEDYVIGADTVVVCDGRVFGKPKDEDAAFEMLSALSGRTHSVYTGVTVIHGGKTVSACEETCVGFRKLSDAEIRAYIASGEPMDKAGAYGAQGKGAALVSRIEGDFFNVMGLPLCRLCLIFSDSFGVNLLTGENLQ